MREVLLCGAGDRRSCAVGEREPELEQEQQLEREQEREWKQK